jgi:predicted Zn-dependent protease
MCKWKYAAGAGALAMALMSCETEPVTGRKQLSLVGDAAVDQAGAQAYQEVLTKSTIVRSGPEYDRVAQVSRRIAAAAEDPQGEWDKPNFNWEFNVIKDDKTVNAFCLPGGKIAVYSGILPVAQSEAGLATVIGHEVAHALAHHGAERMSRNVFQQFGLEAIDQFLLGGASPGAHQAIMGALGLGAQVGVNLPFSRKQESAADHIGLVLMTKAGYSPREAIEFWKRMESMSKGGQPPEFLSDHPSHERRVTDLQAWLPEVEARYGGRPGASSQSSTLRRGEQPRTR